MLGPETKRVFVIGPGGQALAAVGKFRRRGANAIAWPPAVTPCSRRVKTRVARGPFTPCTLVDSLLEAVLESAKHAPAGGQVLFSPACAGADRHQDSQRRGKVFREGIAQRMRPLAPQRLAARSAAIRVWVIVSQYSGRFSRIQQNELETRFCAGVF